MSSRLAVDGYGRLIVEGTGELRGMRWLVIDLFEIFTPRGRPPTARERAGAREPYNAPAPLLKTELQDVPDEALDEPTAIQLARLEQQREPLHLVSAA